MSSLLFWYCMPFGFHLCLKWSVGQSESVCQRRRIIFLVKTVRLNKELTAFLGRNGMWRLLPRIGNALSQYIKPLTTIAAQPPSTSSEQKERNDGGKKSPPKLVVANLNSSSADQKSPDKNQSDEKQTLLRVLPGGKEDLTSQAPGQGPANIASVTAHFLDLLKSLQSSKGEFARWLGTSAYIISQKKQNQKGKIKKGAMVDHRVE